ncbi:hypothetical protein OCU04_000702 [Sclerotinia nivalis]|uniref:Uncharacterized protein n=1 Tax=Sclerotinia nivalis TaxID=352851 RepID=A0A9X0DQI8_9HELO|nr:hypothetical protein OCU04_000702 [Sclerotinia nivalis]
MRDSCFLSAAFNSILICTSTHLIFILSQILSAVLPSGRTHLLQISPQHKYISKSKMSFNAYMVDFLGVSRGIFVQTDECGRDTGHLYQVIGDMQNGMIHAHKEIKRPNNSSRFIGTVSASQYSQVRTVCDSITAGPPKIDPANSLRHYQEWTNSVVEMLYAREVLQRPNPLSMSTQFQHTSRLVDQCCSPINDSRSFDWLSASRMQAPGMAM